MSSAVKYLPLSFGILAVATGWAGLAQGAGITVNVSDQNGEPVKQVAVYIERVRGGVKSSGPAGRPHAVMDQKDHAFVPHVLIVEAGTEVDFPNSDAVSHHVYSFSPAKKFELPLYKGRQYPPVQFDEPGLVTLGCNIHDDMVGYILVVETPYYVLTNESGVARFAGLPADEYAVHVWTPRLRQTHLPAPIAVELAASQDEEIEVRFGRKLYPAHAHAESSLSWANY